MRSFRVVARFKLITARSAAGAISEEKRLGAQEADGEFGLGEATLALGGDAVGGAVRAVGDHLGERLVDEVRAHAVVAGQAAGEGARRDQALVERPTLGLGVIVRAEA